MAGQQTLNLFILVRIQVPEPEKISAFAGIFLNNGFGLLNI